MIKDFENLRQRIFNIKSYSDFREVSLQIFNYQFDNNVVYHDFIISLGKIPSEVRTLADIPFLPVEFFRNHKIVSGNLPVEMIFESSGTTGATAGKHFINDLSLYEESFLNSFRLFYGEPEKLLITALLPSYTERKGSSLVYMADNLIRRSKYPQSGFYKSNFEDLIRVINEARKEKVSILLLGVSFALVDLAENKSSDLSGVIVMETGGMKGRRKELTRYELHGILRE
jgi:phenylacetate-coenzyme A ligase PaaK-like adenylate-forming protein